MNKTWINISMAWLVIVSLLGILLRLWPSFDLTIPYRNILHAHSHLAFLGWVCSALFTLIAAWFLPQNIRSKSIYKTLFILLQLCNVGMLISFPIQGYGMFSILFSTLHLLFAGWFGVCVLKDIQGPVRKTLSFRFMQTAIVFMMVSAAGPLLMPVMIKVYGSGSAPYHNAIYYYLHFQYNGWFTFALLGLLLRHAENKGLNLFNSAGNTIYLLFTTATVIGITQSFLWANPASFVWIMAGIAGLLQLTTVALMLQAAFKNKSSLNNILSKPVRNIFLLVLAAFLVKTLLQALSALPWVAEAAATSRPLVIAYLHLVLLGCVTFAILALFHEANALDFGLKSAKTGFALFFSGFVISELSIVAGGLHLPWEWISSLTGSSSLLMPAGIVLIFLSRVLREQKQGIPRTYPNSNALIKTNH